MSYTVGLIFHQVHVLKQLCHNLLHILALVFLTNEHPGSRLIHTCVCNNPSRWVMSSDHHRTDIRTLNTSLPLYTITNGNTLMLNLDSVSGEDGGFYQCDCGTGYSGFCILVYGELIAMSTLASKHGHDHGMIFLLLFLLTQHDWCLLHALMKLTDAVARPCSQRQQEGV